MTFFSRLVCRLSCLGTYTGIFTALMSQIVGKHPAGLVKYISGQTVVAVRRVFFMCFQEKFGQENTIFLIAIRLSFSASPFVVSGSIDIHDPAQKVYRVFHPEFFDDFVVFPLPVTYSLFAPAPSTQYPFFKRAISTSCFATISRSRSTSLSDLLVYKAV